MNAEVESIIRSLKSTLEGQPWFGRPVYSILNEIHPALVYKKPHEKSHSLIDLLYHMITWAEFTSKRIQKDQEKDLKAFEELDWRMIDPVAHTWLNGINEFKEIHEQIINVLGTKTDEFLKEKVDYREYNFRFLLNGLIQHNIYHLGQIAYLKKLLAE